MKKNQMLIIGLVIVVAALVVALLSSMGIITLPGASPYSSQQEVSEAVSDMSVDIDKMGATLEEIDQALT